MPFVTRDHLNAALDNLAEAHPLRIISYLAMFKADVPLCLDDEQAQAALADGSPALDGPLEREFLDDYLSFGLGSATHPWFQPTKREWIAKKYPGSSSQRQRDDRSRGDGVFLKLAGAKYFPRAGTWQDWAALDHSGGPADLSSIAIVLFALEDVASLDELVSLAASTFKIPSELVGTLYTDQHREDLSQLPLQDVPMQEADLTAVLNADLTRALASDLSDFEEVVDQFSGDLRASGRIFGHRHDQVVSSFVVALATKPFLILTGLSGSGKTQLALSFGKWLGQDRLKVCPVRPDWTSPEALLGYENSLSVQIDGGYAWNAPEALRFILAAHNDPHHPYLLLLDEMNLAHVERYFADVLSGMESGESIVPNLVELDGEWRRDAGPELVPLPPNLFIVGTVNVDETTYMFSPKVLDRANTIEFRVETVDLDASGERPGDMAPASPELAAGFLHAAKTDPGPGSADVEVAEWVKRVHELLAEEGREFGHRTFHEIRLFARKMEAAGRTEHLEAFDLQLLQKVLPRLHGSRSELTELLNRLGSFCVAGPEGDLDEDFDAADQPSVEAKLPRSFDKIHRMAKRLRSNHFVAFAE